MHKYQLSRYILKQLNELDSKCNLYVDFDLDKTTIDGEFDLDELSQRIIDYIKEEETDNFNEQIRNRKYDQ
ncbi:hypothetical protein SEA_WEASELS2_251 [Rhodococcus phage Weasels2]|uniref:Uncharacterized protein n=1 Tax=Rhodococcus phage Weasels2 TaxID=1897437 RepID=A0A1I9SAM3_9CAUD|nr:hypothetical protein FDH04_gp165 [Rhodococcus phage Weasels2]AOZ63829.1 hypothetical protein SEA_WEASELS2_251 [Rhodococcus phage Weasels2]